MTKLTGSYNEYGYVVRKDGRSIYAAGNSAYESQGYIGSELTRRVGMSDNVLKKEIPGNASVLPLETIAKYCENTITEMCDRPDLWAWKLKKDGDYEVGSIKYSKNLNPLEQAYICGALLK